MLKVLINLHKINAKIEQNALNKNHIKNQNDYIEQLKEKIDGDQKKEIEEIKHLNVTFLKAQNINLDDLNNMSNEEIVEKIKKFLE